VTVGSFVIYALLAAPSVSWFDAGELAGAGFTLGISHPPGQPVYTLLAKAASLLPLGPVAFRIGLLSAAAAALGLGLLVRIGRAIWPGPAGAAAGVVAALILGVNRAFVTQALRVEVYAPLLSLVLLAVLVALPLRDRCGPGGRRRTLAAALALGLATGVHSLLAALTAAPLAALVAIWLGPRHALRLLPGALAAFGLALLATLYLPLRSAADPAIRFGAADTPVQLREMLTATAYAQNFSLDLATVIRHVLGHLRLLADLVSIPGLLVAALGVILLRTRRAALVVSLLIGLPLLASVLQAKLFPENPDLLGYLLVPLALIALAGAAALPTTLAIFAGASRAARCALAGGLAAALVFLGGNRSATDPPDALRDDHAAADWADALLAPVVPGPAVLVLGSDHGIFLAWYGQAVEGQRPDVAVVAHHLVGAVPGFHRQHLKRRHPWLFMPYLDDGVRREVRRRLVAQNAARVPIYAEQPWPRSGLPATRLLDCGTVLALEGSGGRAACQRRAAFPAASGRQAELVRCHTTLERGRYHLARQDPAAALAELRGLAHAITPGPVARRLGASEDGAFLCDPAAVLSLHGTVLTMMGRSAEAEPWLRRALAIDERDEQANVLLGLDLARRGRLGPAAERLEAAVEGHPRSVQAWFYLGLVRRARGQMTEAEAAWRRAQELGPAEFESLRRGLGGPASKP
jgi:hypothetical protein